MQAFFVRRKFLFYIEETGMRKAVEKEEAAKSALSHHFLSFFKMIRPFRDGKVHSPILSRGGLFVILMRVSITKGRREMKRVTASFLHFPQWRCCFFRDAEMP